MALLTIEELLQKKDILTGRKTETFLIEVKDVGEFRFRIPALSDIDDANAFMDGKDTDAYLVNACVVEPRFSDERMREVYGVSTGIDVVKEIFLGGEIQAISNELVRKAGYSSNLVKVVEQVKN
nr:MAG TPA: tail assembly chaperone protein [Caudoviricetes sp.]